MSGSQQVLEEHISESSQVGLGVPPAPSSAFVHCLPDFTRQHLPLPGALCTRTTNLNEGLWCWWVIAPAPLLLWRADPRQVHRADSQWDHVGLPSWCPSVNRHLLAASPSCSHVHPLASVLPSFVPKQLLCTQTPTRALL